jgi:hypothetical protein
VIAKKKLRKGDIFCFIYLVGRGGMCLVVWSSLYEVAD